MKGIEDLAISLATGILRYHDSQPTKTKVIKVVEVPTPPPEIIKMRYRARAIQIINNPDAPYEDVLNTLISACVAHHDKRGSLLHFILHEINFLQSLLKKTTPFSEEECADNTRKIAQLFFDINALFKTPKDQTCLVNFSKLIDEDAARDRSASVALPLDGFLNNSYVGGLYSLSGTIFFEESKSRFNLTTEPADLDIAHSFMDELNNSLLVAALRERIITTEATQAPLDLRIAALEGVIAELQNRITATEEDHRAALEAKDAQIIDLKEQVGVLKQRQAVAASQSFKLPTMFSRIAGTPTLKSAMLTGSPGPSSQGAPAP